MFDGGRGGSKGKGTCHLLLFWTDRPFVCGASEAAARPLLLLHANEISTAAVSVLSLITVTAAGWPALCRHPSPSLIKSGLSIEAHCHYIQRADKELYE